MYPLVSPLSRQRVDEIIAKLSFEDAPIPEEHMPPKDWVWLWPKWLSPKRRLTESEAARVQRYINFIVRNDYPYQVREYMGRHLWLEFCEYYAVNPDIERSLRYI